GARVILDVPFDLDYDTEYRLIVEGNIVEDLNGNNHVDVLGEANITFTTVFEASSDILPPVINLLGDDPLILNIGDIYIEPGATATDDVDGDVSADMVIDATAVDISTVGSYEVTYNVSDAAGNAADEVVRTVEVEEAVGIIPPILVNTVPVDNATQVPLDQDIILTFDEPVQRGQATLTLVEASSGRRLSFFSLNQAEVLINGAEVTIRPMRELNPNISYHVEIDENFVQDLDGSPFSGLDDPTVFNFGTITIADATPPELVSNNPEDGMIDVPVDVSPTFTFNEPVVNINNITIFESGNTSKSILLSEFNEGISVNGNEVILNPPSNLDFSTTYVVASVSGSFEDLSGNDYIASGLYSFTTASEMMDDLAPPVITLVGDDPLILNIGDSYIEPGATATDNVDGDISANIVIDATAVDVNTVGSYEVTYNVSDAAGNAADEVLRTIEVEESTGECTVNISQQPLDLNICEGGTGSFSVVAEGNGSLRYQWQVGASGQSDFFDFGAGQAIGQNPTIPVNGPGLVSNGNKYRVIVSSDNGTPDDTDDDCTVISDVVILNVNANPTTDITGPATVPADGEATLDAGAGFSTYQWSPGGETTQTITTGPGTYTVTVTNAAGCEATSQPFTVNEDDTDNSPPLLVSLEPSNGAINVSVDGNLTIELNEPIRLGTGTIQLFESAVVAESYDVASSVRLSVSGNSLIIDPGNDLINSGNYYLNIPAGAIEDMSGNNFSGILSFSDWNFMTEASNCMVSIDTQPIDKEGCDDGSSDSFSVVASGIGTLSYNWQRSVDGFNFNDLGDTDEIFDFVYASNLDGVQYRVMVTSDNGTPDDLNDDCSMASAIVTLTVNTNPTPEISGADRIAIGEMATLDAGAGFSSYLWSPGGETTPTISTGPGTYTVTVRNAAGCEAISLPFTVEEEHPSDPQLAVVEFILVDADINLPLFTLTEGQSIDISTLPTLNLNIEAVTSGNAQSVRLELSGPSFHTRTENFVPYALFGDISGDFIAGLFPMGDFTITATPYSEDALGGIVGMPATLNFSVVATPVDADNDGFFNDVDCDDSDNTVFPGAPEVCDGKDNNCDGLTDGDDPNLTCDETVQAEADLVEATYLQGSKNPQPFGPLLRVEKNNRETYIKFDLSDFSGALIEAVLEMQVTGDPGNGNISVFLGSSSNWSEDGLSRNNKPNAIGNALAFISGTHALGQTIVWNLDVSRLSTGNELTLIVKHGNGNDVAFASDETTNAPKLIITTGSSSPSDNDGDGFLSDVDCNDNDDTVFPGAPEICDGKDNNCDGLIDGAEPGVSCGSPVEVDADLIEATYLQGANNPEPLGSVLRVEQENRETYLKFDLSNFNSIFGARLEMEVTSDPGNGTIEVFLGSDSNWTETGLRGFNSPDIVGETLARLKGTHTVGQTKVWNLDVSRLPEGNELTLIVKHSDGNDVAFASDETVMAPRLILTVADDAGKTKLNELVISPNPANVDTHIALKSPSGRKLSKGLSVFDIQGRLVLTVSEQEADSAGDYTLHVDGLENGTYFIKAYDENGTPYVKQMIIIR
ncbi:Ig-like domain-containing protein, partial [Maribacter sp.]